MLFDKEVKIVTGKAPAATGRVALNAEVAEVYRVISDPTTMIRFAEEAYAAHWLDGATEAVVGARFRGLNRNGRRHWQVICRITELEPGRRCTHEVSTTFNVPISRWRYEIEPTEDGCVLTESNWILAPLWFIPIAMMITGVFNRPGLNRTHIATTLDRLKAHVEAGRA